MSLEFDWCGCTAIDDEHKRQIENSIRQTFHDRGDMEIRACHDGQIKVQLNIVGPLLSELVGNLMCSCGKKYCKFAGNSDASTVTFKCID